MPSNHFTLDYDVIIVGGGLAGLTAAILLSKNKKKVLLIEKKSYPFHKVCGEYVSNEVLPFLQSLGFNPFKYGASKINRLRVSTPSGKNIFTSLDLGGFGLSRYVMDNELYKLAKQYGATVLTETKVTDISFSENIFSVETNTSAKYTSKIVIGGYGKRDTLDKKLERNFIQSHTGYMGVKYHIKTDYPIDEIGLDNFEGGYCGIAKIEEDKYNLCYLYRRNSRYPFKTIPELEDNVLFKNPVLKNIFKNAQFLYTEPLVINEISFAPKKLIENHVLMCGDSAGLITPLCGNGMAMAIHSAKLLSDLIVKTEILTGTENLSVKRQKLEEEYKKVWKQNFNARLFFGRNLQKLLGNTLITGTFIRLIHTTPKIKKWLIEQTHGKEVVF